jgi:predicted ribosome quality control (RQC) complex YloA/Tae2 family protein
MTYVANVGFTSQPIGGTVFGVTVDNVTGKLGFQPSSRRYKEHIEPMDKASETLFALEPVIFRYKKEIDPKQHLDYGLIAENVAKLNPELAIRNGKGEIESLNYTAIYAMMLNEFIKAHRKNEEQEATIARLEQRIEALTAGLEKVSGQIEASKPALQVVNNP